MLRRVTWRPWAALAAVLGAYTGAGFWFSGDGPAEYQLYKWGLTVLVFAPVVLMSAYVARGNRFWTNDLGSIVAVLAGGITWMAWPLAYTFWFSHGRLTASWAAWCEVSGPALVALAVLGLCGAFLRGDRDERDERGGGP